MYKSFTIIFFVCFTLFNQLNACFDEDGIDITPIYSGKGISINLVPKHCREIQQYGDFLLKNTCSNDLVLFLGRSPWLVSEYWRYKQVDRQFFNVSYSGKAFKEKIDNDSENQSTFIQLFSQFPPMTFENSSSSTIIPKIVWDEPTIDELNAYRRYLIAAGIDQSIKNFLNKTSGSIALVDMTAKGLGVASFAKLLNTLYPEIIEHKKHMMIHNIYAIPNPSDEEKLSFLNHISKYNTLNKLTTIYAHNTYIKSTMAFFTEIPSFDSASNSQHFTAMFILNLLEFSTPGLCHFSKEEWTKVNPMTQKKTNYVSLIIAFAHQVWSKKPI